LKVVTETLEKGTKNSISFSFLRIENVQHSNDLSQHGGSDQLKRRKEGKNRKFFGCVSSSKGSIEVTGYGYFNFSKHSNKRNLIFMKNVFNITIIIVMYL